MASKKLLDALNTARAEELAAIMQYMNHHYLVDGIYAEQLKGVFKATAIVEMKHAEALGERINFLGGNPTADPSPFKKGGDYKKMLQDDLAMELKAVKMYKDYVKLADSEGDSTTRRLFEELLEDEEGHVDTFQTLLVKEKK